MKVAVMASLVVSVKTVSTSVCGATGPVVTTTGTTVHVGLSQREKLEMTISILGHTKYIVGFQIQWCSLAPFGR